MNILFIGDIVGKIGREAVARVLPKLKKEKDIDLAVANAENSAHGSGITEKIIRELKGSGVDCFTTGDHAFTRPKQTDVYWGEDVLRPANFPPGVPGAGHRLIKAGRHNVLVVNLIGRVFMKMDYDCPFRELDEILANFDLHDSGVSAIITDIHAEATSEKVALGHYADGRVSAVVGSHTHVMTADARVSAGGTAQITDAGMVGLADGCIGLDKENIIKSYLHQIKYSHVLPEKGRAVFNAVLIRVNSRDGRAKSIRPVVEYVNIN